jgi:dTDP-4-amino-4,6-dideoxygalactose transaminase
LPVVIDAAAGFDVARPGAIPTVISLHATKVLGVGEGGFVMSSDASLIREIRTRSNFGFRGTREAVMPATNAKLSEYHAAVGLAALDEWTDARPEWMAVAEAYRQALPESNRLTYQPEFGQSWIASTCMLRLRHGEASRLEQALQQAGIETRRWWGEGAHSHAASAAFPRTMLPVTEELALSTIAIPFFRDLELAEVQQVTERVVAATPD